MKLYLVIARTIDGVNMDVFVGARKLADVLPLAKKYYGDVDLQVNRIIEVPDCPARPMAVNWGKIRQHKKR